MVWIFSSPWFLTEYLRPLRTSGTIGSYLIATKPILQLTPLEFRKQFYAHFPRWPPSEKNAERGPSEGQGTSGTIGSYLIATKAIPQLTTLEFPEQFYPHSPVGH